MIRYVYNDSNFIDSKEDKKLTINDVVFRLNEYHEKVSALEGTVGILDSIGLLDLMIDYNLDWKSVYNIIKEKCRELKEQGEKNDCGDK